MSINYRDVLITPVDINEPKYRTISRKESSHCFGSNTWPLVLLMLRTFVKFEASDIANTGENYNTERRGYREVETANGREK